VKVLDAGKAYKEALANPVSATGDRFSDFLDGWAEKEVDAIDRLVSKGYTQGWTNDEMATAIRGTKAAEYADGLAPRLAANADTIVRTSVMHVANTAMEMTWAANSDIIEEEQVVATLDSRTTPGCRFLDGRRYPLGKGPSFPRHYNCRTIKVPVLNAQFAFLEEGSTRASAAGQVDANLTYYSWLKTQGEEFQIDALGPTRAQLFREGGLSAESFGRLNIGRNFEPMTLDEMRKKEPTAFKRAGL
jgi:SPP1 gp7 family putative phage head morphogenesis protein